MPIAHEALVIWVLRIQLYWLLDSGVDTRRAHARSAVTRADFFDLLRGSLEPVRERLLPVGALQHLATLYQLAHAERVVLRHTAGNSDPLLTGRGIGAANGLRDAATTATAHQRHENRGDDSQRDEAKVDRAAAALGS